MNIINNNFNYKVLMQVCNLNCICCNVDCTYKHFIPPKERKIVKRFYDKLINPLKIEKDNSIRNANCTYGQLCNNEKCGYRHRLSFEDRKKLIIAYKYNKICPEKEEKPTQVINISSPSIINGKNLFSALNDEDNEDIDDNDSNDDNDKVEQPARIWADIVITGNVAEVIPMVITEIAKPIIDIKPMTGNWDDLCDNDYLMTF